MSSSAVRRERFLSIFPEICDELISHFSKSGMPKDAQEWYKRSLEYNVPGGKLNRGISVTDTIEILRGRPLDDNEYKRYAVLGWCVELMQAFFLVSDDIMDASITRRGQPCWYRIPTVGNIAINDAFLLEGAIYHLLKIYFRQERYYVELLDLFHETTFQTEMGQMVDLLTAPEDHVDLNRFSLDKHHFIVVYKTAYYSFYLPVALAMLTCHITDPQSFTLARDILIPLGEYFQVQDDFLDCFGTPEQIGKIGTDIVDNKCSWCINIALANASPEQRQILDDSYGQHDPEKEAKVKAVYEELNLRGKYEQYETDSYNKLMGLIQTIPEVSTNGVNGANGKANGEEEIPLKRDVFKAFLNKIYKRTK